MLEITAFKRPSDYSDHFKQGFGPTIVAQNHARLNGCEAEFEEALDQFADQ